jgi:uncharacterized repeat protein (TIGR01451 family)
VSINVSNPNPIEGEIVTYTINVANTGPSDATGVMLNLPIPPNVTYQGFSGTGSYDSGSGIWTIGGMITGQNHSLNMSVQINTGISPTTITTNVNISGAQTDPNSGNNASSVNMNV